jgi:hypothetical protein
MLIYLCSLKDSFIRFSKILQTAKVFPRMEPFYRQTLVNKRKTSPVKIGIAKKRNG